MNKISVSLVLCLLLMLLWGCQSTPVEQTVKTQNKDYLVDAPENDSVRYDAPERLSETKVLTDNLTIVYDAEIDIPYVSGYMVQAVRQKEFTDTEILNLIAYFCPGANLTEPVEATKSEIAQQIADLKEAHGSDDLDEQTAGYLSYLENQMETAPLESNSAPFDLTNIETGGYYNAHARNADETLSRFSGVRNGSSFCYVRDDRLSLYRQDILLPHEDAELLKHYEEPFPVSETEAQAVAQSVVAELGFSDLRLLSSERICSFIGNKVQSKGWDFIFTRDNNGLQSYFSFNTISYGGVNVPLPTLCSPWGQEVLLLSVDAEGVLCFDLRNYEEYNGILRKNVKLCPWEDLREQIEKQLFYHHAYSAEQSKYTTIRINDIILRSATVNVFDDLDTGRTIPVWLIAYTYEAEIEKNIIMYTDCIYFNAIDGTYIEPRVPYEIWLEDLYDQQFQREG